MSIDRVKFQDVVESQLPRYVREDFPLLGEFLEQYYVSQEFQSAPADLIQNIDKYVKIDELVNLKTYTILEKDVSYIDQVITASVEGNFTEGFPETNGLIKIDDEIIEYEYKTDQTFVNCSRAFSGITTYMGSSPDQLTFTKSEVAPHKKGAVIHNLNIIFLQEFFKKVKKQFVPGFTERNLHDDLDQRNFIFGSDTFYKSKGTEESFKILFRALYGEEVEIIKPSKFLLKPSNADYRVTQDFVVESVNGDVLDLKNRTIFQDSSNSRGTVTNVEKIHYSEGDYYQISVDSGYQRDIDTLGSIYGDFKPNPKTQALNAVSIGATIIDVDSTIGFPWSGNIVGYDADGNPVSMDYTGTNSTQFLSVSGVDAIIPETANIRWDDVSYATVGIGQSIQVRLTSTLTEFKVNGPSEFYSKDDTVRIQSLGKESDLEKSRNWKFNIKTKWVVDSITLLDSSERSYEVVTYDDQFLQPGYFIDLIDDSNQKTSGSVSRIISSTKFTIRLSGLVDVGKSFTIRNDILKGNSSKYTQIQDFFANIQNTYVNFDEEVLVASNSIPNYPNLPLNAYDKVVTFSGSSQSDNETLTLTSGTDHGFYNGDAVFYEPGVIRNTQVTSDGVILTIESESKFDDIDAGVYYVKRINSTDIKLSNSKSDIFEGKYIKLAGEVADNKFCYYDFYLKYLAPQGIYREIAEPVNKSGTYETDPGYTGILINGAEVINYKSQNSIYYGDVQSFDVTGGGNNYDVINPPILIVQDSVGTGATGICDVEGQLERLELLDTGYDYVDTPTVKITGGNPIEDAAAEVNMAFVIHSPSFNAERTGENVDIINSTIGFSTFHKFDDNERVMYDPNDLSGIVGLTTDNYYYVGVVDNYTIKLYTNPDDSRVGINTVDLVSFGSGVQNITSAFRKRIVSNIVVTNPGKGYKNRKRQVISTGISTALNKITIKDHGYSSGDVIQYAPGSIPIKGLSDNEKYYVKKVDNNVFCLTLVGTGVTDLNYYYDNDIKVDLMSTGDGTFNYEPISVSVEGNIGVNVRTGQDFTAKVQPIFRGSVQSIDLISGGVGYGASEVFNFNRQPTISLSSGEGALLTPIIQNGKIDEVIINSPGNSYNSPPDIVVSGTGSNTRLTPVIDPATGNLAEVKVINGGVGFDTDSTSLTVTSAGLDAKIDCTLRTWTINLFERNFNTLTDDDGFINENIDSSSLEYSHLYAPRPLRESTYVLAGEDEDNTLYGIADLQVEDGVEIASKYHSPILGWSYDGNPIYGPYGYTNADGGNIKQIQSGYELSVNETHRPPTSLYGGGFFVEDYIFTERGDLDEHNGRFCITPDFPRGKYCYFTTLNMISVDSEGPFTNYKRPAFPYIIGNTFESEPNIFNFGKDSNQKSYDIEDKGWFRNTKVYHTNDDRSSYDYVFNSNKIKESTVEIQGTSIGTIENVGIVTGGSIYKVNDRLVFDNDGTEGQDASARVERVAGKTINTVSCATTVFYNIEFSATDDRRSFIGFSTQPHDLENFDIVNISGLSEYFAGFDGSYTIGIRSDNFVTTLGIGNTATTGLTTYFYVSGLLEYPYIRENDILGIGTEKVKVLNIDGRTERIRVLREYGGTVGTAYTSLTQLFEDPRKFKINVGSLKTTKTFRINREEYFNPAESVGLGTVTGVGVGNTIVFSMPGVGVTQVFVQPQSIYMEDHNLQLNDVLYYRPNGGTSIVTWNGIEGEPYRNLLHYEKLYAAPVGRNFIGVSSTRVGMTTTGYVGINTTNGLLYFTSIGAGVYHSFKTSLSNVISGQVDKNIVTVSTASTHGLKSTLLSNQSGTSDKVYMSIEPKDIKTLDIKYNDYNRRIVFDPLTFAAGDVDTVMNTITFTLHKFKKGDKVIHTASTPVGGLVNEAMYYVIPFSGNKIRLVEEKFQLDEQNPAFVNFTSASTGTLSKINPLIEVKRGQKLKFDLSDPSLSFIQNGITYSAFSLDIFTDDSFNNRFLTSKANVEFEVTSSGKVGIDADAHLTIKVDKNIPQSLYYKFQLDNLDIIPTLKSELIIDKDVNPSNKIFVVKTAYDGKHSLTGIGTTTFTFNIGEIPDVFTYNDINSVLTYDTDALTTEGAITKIKMLNDGNGYKSLPKITSVTSDKGTGAIINAQSTNIGKVLNSRLGSIGFDYPTDTTLRATANLPEILKIEALASFESIGIASAGRNYLVSPKIIVKDGYTGKIVPNIDITYKLGDKQVTILQNTTGIYDVPPTIIPIRNSNGVGFSSLTYNASTKTVRIFPDATFSDPLDFPYNPGSKIMVENVSVGVGSTGTGYNSENYNYSLFEVSNADSQLGGTGAWIEYKLTDYLGVGDVPGTMDASNSKSRVISEIDFPIYSPVLKKNNFFKDEEVISDRKVGYVENWNSKIEQLKITTGKEFTIGSIVKGTSSNTQGVIESKIDFNSEILIGAGTTVYSGWQSNSGFLNDSLQKLPNNEYYQNFSYSLESRVPLQTWDDPVSSLNHTSGFAKFSDLVIESDSADSMLTLPEDTNIEIVNEIVGYGDFNCYYDFDYVTEGTIEIGDINISTTIDFENRTLTDFYESVGNRVLTIDDMSSIFNSNPRATSSSPVAAFAFDRTYNKIFTFAQDTTYTDERQFSIVSLLQYKNIAYSNQYATIYTYPYGGLGSYDYSVEADNWRLTWNPIKSEYNNYAVSVVDLGTLNDAILTEKLELGTVGIVTGFYTEFGAGVSSSRIARIPDTYRSAKVHIQVESAGGSLGIQEMNLCHDGSDVFVLEYGELTNTLGETPDISGFGTFSAGLSYGDMIVAFHPDNTGIAHTVNTSVMALSVDGVGIGSTSLSVARVSTGHKAISSSGSPTSHVVASFDEPYKSGYYFMSVEDTTTNQYQCSEIAIIKSDTNEAFVEFANVETGNSIGTVGISSVGSNLDLLFTPIASVNAEVRVIGFELQIYDDNANPTLIDLNNVVIESDNGSYKGSHNDVVTAFDLTHESLDIFKRDFDGSNGIVVGETGEDIIEDGLIMYLDGETADGTTTWTDRSSSGNDATLINLTTKYDSYGYNFRNARRALVSDTDFDFSGDFAFEVWSKMENTPSAVCPSALISSWSTLYSVDNIFIVYIDHNGNLITSFNHNQDGKTQFDFTYDGGTVLLDEWNHVVVTRIGQYIDVYLNGVKGTTQIYTESIDSSPTGTDIWIGAYAGCPSYSFNGTMGIVRTYKDKGLDSFQVSKNYLAQRGRYIEGTNIYPNGIQISDHFFVTGEQLTYAHAGAGTTQAIGIVTTTIPGIGATDKLPPTVYAVKENDGVIRLASTAENALKTSPVTLDISSVGIGTSHSLTSPNANNRALICIDNMIQSPIAGTAVTTTLSSNIIQDTKVPLVGVTSIAARDLIKIEDEIMIVEEVGFGGATNLLVRRAQVGTQLASHSTGTLVTKISGNYNIVGNTLHFSQAPYGQVPLSTTVGNPDYRDWTGISTSSTFQGRTFIRSAAPDSVDKAYTTNYIFDDISEQFTGITSHFNLTSDYNNITGFSTDNAIVLINSIFQEPQGVQASPANYNIDETSGITSVTFTGSGTTVTYDTNAGDLPRGGVIISVESSPGLGYQPLVSAGGTANVSGLGTISSISIGNTGSGYREGVQSTVNVGVQTYSDGIPAIEFIGTAAISGGHIVSVAVTNPGSGYTSTNPPEVVFDDPLAYTNMPLIYSSSSVSGVGTEATIDIVVGQGSSVIDFEVKYTGHGYGNGEILTIGVGGSTGIPQDTSLSFTEFSLTISRTYKDSFNGWSIGVLEPLDKLDDKFDGTKTAFRLTLNEAPFSVRSKPGSNIEVDKTLMVFINEVLQEPEVAYTFTGGSVITFVEPPDAGDKSKILFYKGTGDLDVVFNDILETVKVGDSLDINNNPAKGQGYGLEQDPRVVVGLNTVDSVSTNPYDGPGITTDTTLSRPVTWCRQTIDKVIDGVKVGKDRIHYEPLIYPAAYLLQPIVSSSTTAYVDNLRPFFDPDNEQQIRGFQNKIEITSQDSRVGAMATAIVSVAGSITSLDITNSGIGYTLAPSISISNPIGVGTTGTSKAVSELSDDNVSLITVQTPGYGYTTTNPPSVLIESPKLVRERINVNSYTGDNGVVVGFGISTFVSGMTSQTKIILDFYIPTNSYMRDTDVVGSAITVSGISTGDFFTTYNTSVAADEETIISLQNDGVTQVAITTSFLDSVFQVSDTQLLDKNVIGVGVTMVKRVFANISGISTVDFASTLITFDSTNYTFDSQSFAVYAGGISSSAYLGSYSWGKIDLAGRTNPQSFNFYGEDGYSGISSSGLVTRYNPLKYKDYIV